MKFIVVTYGTEGDARPFAALCRGLMDAERLRLAGVASIAVDSRRPKAEAFATATQVRDRARILGEMIGVVDAVAVIERIVAS